MTNDQNQFFDSFLVANICHYLYHSPYTAFFLVLLDILLRLFSTGSIFGASRLVAWYILFL